MFSYEYCKNFKNTYFDENLANNCFCHSSFLLLIFLLKGLFLLLISIGLLRRSSSMFKEFSLGCLMVASSLIWKKEKLAEIVPRWAFFKELAHWLGLKNCRITPLKRKLLPQNTSHWLLIVQHITYSLFAMQLIVIPSCFLRWQEHFLRKVCFRKIAVHC